MINSWLKKFDTPVPPPIANGVADPQDLKAAPLNPETFEQIYKGAAVKPPDIAYGIQKVTDMANSAHLVGMPPEFKRKALLMALNAAGTDEGQVLNDLVIRQKALKEYEDAFQERVDRFEAALMDQNRLQHEGLATITSEFMARIQANLDLLEIRRKEFRIWQEKKRQEVQRFAEAAALCVPQDRSGQQDVAASNVTPMLRPTGTFR